MKMKFTAVIVAFLFHFLVLDIVQISNAMDNSSSSTINETKDDNEKKEESISSKDMDQTNNKIGKGKEPENLEDYQADEINANVGHLGPEMDETSSHDALAIEGPGSSNSNGGTAKSLGEDIALNANVLNMDDNETIIGRNEAYLSHLNPILNPILFEVRTLEKLLNIRIDKATKRQLAKQYTNTDLLPSSVHDYWILTEYNPKLFNIDKEEKDILKPAVEEWRINFYAKDHREHLDQIWVMAKKLYNEGKLEHVVKMRVATAYFKDEDIIGMNFDCDVNGDLGKALVIGRNIAKQFEPLFRSIFHYSTPFLDSLHYVDKTNNMNSKVLFKLSDVYVNTNLRPTSVDEYEFLYERSPEIMAKNPIEPGQSGKWMIYFDKNILDQKWEQAKRLYREGKLEGIREICTSTSYDSPRASDKTKGVILFFCGPANSAWKVKHYGRKLLEIMPNFISYGHIAYKSDAQSVTGSRKTGQKVNHLYMLDVPLFSGKQINKFGKNPSFRYNDASIIQHKMKTQLNRSEGTWRKI